MDPHDNSNFTVDNKQIISRALQHMLEKHPFAQPLT